MEPSWFWHRWMCCAWGAKKTKVLKSQLPCRSSDLRSHCQYILVWSFRVICMGYFQRNQDVLDPLSSMKRADYGLPEDKFLFACFNQLYKMDADIFSAWLVFWGLIIIECCLFFSCICPWMWPYHTFTPYICVWFRCMLQYVRCWICKILPLIAKLMDLGYPLLLCKQLVIGYSWRDIVLELHRSGLRE
jgi:hypothetical protein